MARRDERLKNNRPATIRQEPVATHRLRAENLPASARKALFLNRLNGKYDSPVFATDWTIPPQWERMVVVVEVLKIQAAIPPRINAAVKGITKNFRKEIFWRISRSNP